MQNRLAVAACAALCASFAACGTPPTQLGRPPKGPLPENVEASNESPSPRDPALAAEGPPPSREVVPVPAAATSPAEDLVVVGKHAPLALTAPSFPRIDRVRRMVIVADTGDDRFAFQSSLSFVALQPGQTRGQRVLEVFSRERFEALSQDEPALDREIRQAALRAHTKLGTRTLGERMTPCTIARRETDDATSCAAGQTIRCGDLTATFDGQAGLLRHAGATTRHAHWSKTTLRSPEHAASFDVVACFREAAWDPETNIIAALVDRQCVASGGDWCSREPVWTAAVVK